MSYTLHIYLNRNRSATNGLNYDNENLCEFFIYTVCVKKIFAKNQRCNKKECWERSVLPAVQRILHTYSYKYTFIKKN